MALLVDLRITAGISTKSLGMLEIRRLEPLEDRDDPYDEVHRYVAHRVNRAESVEIEHRYGDGAWKLLERALVALDIDTSPEFGLTRSPSV